MKRTVLLIDDDEMVAAVTKTTLERLGYSVQMETAPIRAVDTFSKDPWRFDVVVTDQHMPDLSGLMVSQRLLEMRPDIPIIVMTGSETEDRIKAEALGVRGFVTKPVTRRELAKTIEQALLQGAST